MGLLDNTTQRSYYQGSNQGNYQFTSLEDIINQFMVAYVGEEKIISKVNRIDVAFHAQRALAELSFDTFKSIKSQEIELPPSLTMMLPHDYVNYTRILWTDDHGIKHPIYPTKHTQNPFKIEQNDDLTYDFTAPTSAILSNSDFSDETIGTSSVPGGAWTRSPIANSPTIEDISVTSGALTFTHGAKSLTGSVTSRAYAVYQRIKIDDMDYLEISAKGLSATASSGVKDAGIIRMGLTTLNPNGTNISPGSTDWDHTRTNPNAEVTTGSGNTYLNPTARNHTTSIFNLTTTSNALSYIEFSDGAGTESTETLSNIDVTNVPLDPDGHKYVYVVITSYIPNYSTAWTTSNNNESINTIDDIEILYDGVVNSLQESSESTTWSRYKANKPSENIRNDYDYDDDIFDANIGQRYGLEPSHAQVNGSYFIDNLKGLIHFSSNISGKTVVLDYISDSLGTDEEMQVHKFAEEAMYKWIIHAILSTRSNSQEYQIARFKKERFAAIRNAKLRLSNIKLEEITQILRGKSKYIKH